MADKENIIGAIQCPLCCSIIFHITEHCPRCGYNVSSLVQEVLKLNTKSGDDF